MSTGISSGLMAVLLALVAACAGGVGAAKDVTGVKPPSPGTPSSFHTLVLTGRHAAQTAFVGPGGRLYLVTLDEVFVYSASDMSVGERFPHHGKLLTTPRGERIYRTDESSLAELDPSGVELRKLTFESPINRLTVSLTGAVLGVTTRQSDSAATVTVLRAGDLVELARFAGISPTKSQPVFSADDAYAVAGDRVIDLRTNKQLYERVGLSDATLLFEGSRLYSLTGDQFLTFDFETGRLRREQLSCSGTTRAMPLTHRFVTRCPSDTIVITLEPWLSIKSRLLSRGPFGQPDCDDREDPPLPSERVPAPLRFAKDARATALLQGGQLSLRDGELLVPNSTVTPRLRVGPAIPGTQGAVKIGSQGVPPDAQVLGLAGDRLVLTPDRGAWADVMLVDPRTLEEKEHYLFGGAAMLHVLEDGTFETTGDAASLESLVVCTDGRSVVPLERCARSR